MVDCRGFICYNFEQCECEDKKSITALEELKQYINEVARMSDEVQKYILNEFIDILIKELKT